MTRLKGLGRGLDALLAGTDLPEAETLQTLSLERIQPGKYQPRTRMDDAALDELAASIREHGVMQPILVRPIDGGRFEIVAGERRWRAAKRAGLAAMPALVRPLLNRSTQIHPPSKMWCIAASSGGYGGTPCQECNALHFSTPVKCVNSA